jgi:hypothetical protein
MGHVQSCLAEKVGMAPELCQARKVWSTNNGVPAGLLKIRNPMAENRKKPESRRPNAACSDFGLRISPRATQYPSKLFSTSSARAMRRCDQLMTQEATFAYVIGMGRRESMEGRL